MGGWGSCLRRKEGKVPNNDSLVNLLLQVEPVAQKDSFQSWNREQQVSRVSHGETVGERLNEVFQSEVSRKSGRVCPGILAV